MHAPNTIIVNLLKTLAIIVIFVTFNANTAYLADEHPNATGVKTLIFLGNKNVPPVIYLDNNRPAGVVVDIAHALAPRISQPMEIRAMDWQEAQSLVSKGEADALLQINRTPERDKIYDFSDALLESKFSIFTRTDRVGILGLRNLYGLRAGVEAACLPHDILEKIPDIRLVIISTFLDGLKSSPQGRSTPLWSIIALARMFSPRIIFVASRYLVSRLHLHIPQSRLKKVTRSYFPK